MTAFLFSICISFSLLSVAYMFSHPASSNYFRINKITRTAQTSVNLYMANEGKGKGKGGKGGGGEKRQFASNRGTTATATAGNPVRVARIARALRDELSSIICEGDIKAMVYPDDDLLKSTTVCEVEVSADLSTATIYVSVLGNSVEKRQVFVWLCENVGQVRYEVRVCVYVFFY